jgi:hypothetical protein
MGILNNALGINLTNEDPIIYSPFNESADFGILNPAPPQGYFLELVSPLDPFLFLNGQYQTLL